MKNIKKYFKLFVTAVICLAMCFVPGKRVKAQAEELLTDGRDMESPAEKACVVPGFTVIAGYSHEEKFTKKPYRIGLLFNNVLLGRRGPGDRRGSSLPRIGSSSGKRVLLEWSGSAPRAPG